jgi:hypothetical protein
MKKVLWSALDSKREYPNPRDIGTHGDGAAVQQTHADPFALVSGVARTTPGAWRHAARSITGARAVRVYPHATATPLASSS